MLLMCEEDEVIARFRRRHEMEEIAERWRRNIVSRSAGRKGVISVSTISLIPDNLESPRTQRKDGTQPTKARRYHPHQGKVPTLTK